MDWKLIIKEIYESGKSQAEIAAECGTKQNYISALSTGARNNPSWKIGNKLLILHEKVKRRGKAA